MSRIPTGQPLAANKVLAPLSPPPPAPPPPPSLRYCSLSLSLTHTHTHTHTHARTHARTHAHSINHTSANRDTPSRQTGRVDGQMISFQRLTDWRYIYFKNIYVVENYRQLRRRRKKKKKKKREKKVYTVLFVFQSTRTKQEPSIHKQKPHTRFMTHATSVPPPPPPPKKKKKMKLNEPST